MHHRNAWTPDELERRITEIENFIQRHGTPRTPEAAKLRYIAEYDMTEMRKRLTALRTVKATGTSAEPH